MSYHEKEDWNYTETKLDKFLFDWLPAGLGLLLLMALAAYLT